MDDSRVGYRLVALLNSATLFNLFLVLTFLETMEWSAIESAGAVFTLLVIGTFVASVLVILVVSWPEMKF